MATSGASIVKPGGRTAVIAWLVAWLIAAAFYFYQYMVRSAPAAMLPQLSEAFGLTSMGVAAMLGLFYFGYSPISLIAGVAMDRLGPRTVVSVGAVAVGIGALMFAHGHDEIAGIGRLLQGAGGVCALVGAVYIASRHLPASRAATLIGATQSFGVAGGAAGQYVFGPVVSAGMPWYTFWIGMGIAGLLISALLFLLLPKSLRRQSRGEDRTRDTVHTLSRVFRNPQSILCGLIAGLLFIPTTIFDVIWGARFLQEAQGFDYASAVVRSATVPIGWIIGCPLLGFISDRLGRRKPVILASAIVLLACLAWTLYGRPDVFPPYSIGFLAGLASGAAMLPYTVAIEANPPEMRGTATGVVNFLNFSFSALLIPIFAWIATSVSGGAARMTLEHYQSAFEPLLYGVGLVIVLTFFLKETGTRPGQ